MALRGAAVGLAAALVATAALAWLVGTRRAPDDGRQASYWLAVESLALDGDLQLSEVDRARYAERFGAAPRSVQLRGAGESASIDAPWLWSRLAAASRRSLGHSGPPLLQWSLFVWTAWLAAATLASRLGGGSAALLVGVALFASAAFAAALRPEPRALEMAAMATATAAVWWRRLGPARAADDVYRGDLDARPSLLRWVVAGLAFAPVLTASPAYLPLAVPLVAAAPSERRSAAAALFAVATLALGGGLALAGGLEWSALAAPLSPRLAGWAAVGMLLGRGVGVVPYFVPALLLVASVGAGGEGKRWVLPAVGTAMAMQVLLAPFDLVEGALAPGNAWFLPPLALLLVAAESAESPRATLAVGAVALPLLTAPWLAALGADGAAGTVAARVAVVERWLPVASTLRWQPAVVEIRRGAVTARAFEPAFAAAAGGGLALRAAAGELVVTSDRPLASVRLELGRQAPSELEVRGGELGDVIYRPSGEVAADIAHGRRRARRHPVWWSPGGAWIYPVELRLPETPPAPLPIDLPFGRPELPAPEPR